MLNKVIPLVAAAVLAVTGSFALAQNTSSTPKSGSVSLKQQVQDLRDSIIMLQERVSYLEKQVPAASAPLFPADSKLTNISTNGANFLMSISQPEGNAKRSEFVLTVVNPQSITYTNIDFDIRIFGKDANGDPKAFKKALLMSRVTPAFEAGKTTKFRFAVPDMPVENFAVAYVASVKFGGIASPSAE